MFEFITNNPIAFVIQTVIIIAFITVCAILFRKSIPSYTIVIAGVIAFILGICIEYFDFRILLGFVLVSVLCFVFMNTRGYQAVAFSKKQKKHQREVLDAKVKEDMITILAETCDFLAKRKIGALIAIEQEDPMTSYISKATKIDGEITRELLKTIFFPNTALHDGAVIITGNKVACASAYFPLTDKTDISSQYGTRHRAGIGITEETDAYCIVVSEETGKISLCIAGTITEINNKDHLIDSLRNIK